MKILANQAAQHLLLSDAEKIARVKRKRFYDKELLVDIVDDVRDQDVVLFVNTNPPAENLLEALFLLDLLKSRGARIHLIVGYCGYARQNEKEYAGAFSGKIVLDLLQRVKVESFQMIHMHSSDLTDKNIIYKALFEEQIKAADILCAPDEGAYSYVRSIAQYYHKPFCAFKKNRGDDIEFSDSSNIDLKDKRLLIMDDIIASGKTVIELAKKLSQRHPLEINAAVVHSLMREDVVGKLETSALRKLYISNTLGNSLFSQKLKVVDIRPQIEFTIASLNKKN